MIEEHGLSLWIRISDWSWKGLTEILYGEKKIMPSVLENIKKTFHSILKYNQISLFSSEKIVKFSFQVDVD